MVYYSLQSGKQIETLMNSYLKPSFLKFIDRRLKINNNLFNKIYHNSKDDFEIYNELIKYAKLNFKSKDEAFDFRAKKRVEDINNILDIIGRHSFSRYIDIGSDDCIITDSIREYLNLDIDNTFASDITNKCKKKEQVTFVKLIPFKHSTLYKDINFDTFDMITAFQSIHHMEDRDFRMQEITDLCKDKAVFIIREHDAIDDLLKMFIDIEHLIYEVIIDNIDLNEFINTYYAHYFSKNELEEFMNKFGFQKIYDSNTFGDTRYYYSAYILNI
jgi:SAM-dependent methyltransferase